MGFANMAERNAIEAEAEWSQRDVAKTIHQAMAQVAEKHGARPAITYQLMSGPTDPSETLTWRELYAGSVQAANLFRSLGVGEKDVVAYILPNATETVMTLFGGMMAGIVNPINPLLEPEQIAAILRETGAKVVVTLRSFPKTDVAQKVSQALALAPDVTHVLEVDLLRYLTGVKKFIVPLIRPKGLTSHRAKVLNFNAELTKQPKTLA
ncbi:MAG: AMP-binding protein, partial [Planctomycetota bacterium]